MRLIKYDAIRILNCIIMCNNIMYSSGASYISFSWTFYKILLPCIVLTIIFFHIWMIESYLLSSLFSQLQVKEWVLNRNSWVFLYYHLYFSTSSESMSSKKKLFGSWPYLYPHSRLQPLLCSFSWTILFVLIFFLNIKCHILFRRMIIIN